MGEELTLISPYLSWPAYSASHLLPWQQWMTMLNEPSILFRKSPLYAVSLKIFLYTSLLPQTDSFISLSVTFLKSKSIQKRSWYDRRRSLLLKFFNDCDPTNLSFSVTFLAKPQSNFCVVSSISLQLSLYENAGIMLLHMWTAQVMCILCGKL